MPTFKTKAIPLYMYVSWSGTDDELVAYTKDVIANQWKERFYDDFGDAEASPENITSADRARDFWVMTMWYNAMMDDAAGFGDDTFKGEVFYDIPWNPLESSPMPHYEWEKSN